MSKESDLDFVVAKALQTRLKSYIDDLRTDITEIATGLKISRPVMIKFMHAEGTAIQLPPVTPAKIVSLWEELTAPEKIELDRLTKQYRRTPDDPENLTSEVIRNQAIKQRKLLKERGPDELLIAAGYLPQQMQWLGVSPDRYPQMLQTAILLDNPLLDFDSFMRITQQQLEEVIKVIASSSSSLTEPINEISKSLSNNPTINPDFRKLLSQKYEKACARILLEGYRTDLTPTEALGLFSTILSNEMSRDEHNQLKLRVVNLEFHPLSFSISMQTNKKSVDEHLRYVALEAEKELGNSSNVVSKKMEVLIPPVIETIITCSYSRGRHEDDPNLVRFRYSNCGTLLSTAIHSIALYLGFQKTISTLQIETKDLGVDIGSLVKCTTIIGYGQDSNYVQGNWVDRDLIKTAIQSLLLAGEKWLYQQTVNQPMDRELFFEVFQKVSDLREKLNEARKEFHSYCFLIETESSDNSSHGQVSERLESIAGEAHDCLQRIPYESKPEVWDTFATELRRIFIFSKIHEFRMMNMTGNLSGAFRTRDEISKIFNDQKTKLAFQPLNLLFEAEKKLLDLSTGIDQSLFELNSDSWKSFVDIAKSDVISFLNKRRNSKFSDGNSSDGLSIDVYQSLGTIYSIAGRWLFYTGKTTEDMKLACEFFLQSSHYFSRIGLKQRVARCIALAGRTQVRADNKEGVKDFIKIARDLIEMSLHIGQHDTYKQSVLSEIYLLEGEAALLLESRPDKGLRSSLKGLRGAMWMGLARRIADNLYNISRCAKCLASDEVEIDLESTFGEVFQVLWETNHSRSRAQNNQRLNPLKNKISEDVIDLLCNIKECSSSDSWHRVHEQFKLASSNVWELWNREASKRTSSQHPIAELITNEEFLNSIDS